MKLIYVTWKEVKAFLGSVDEPVSSEFQIIIRTKWQVKKHLGRGRPTEASNGRWVYEVEIPEEMITLEGLCSIIRQNLGLRRMPRSR